ncbi:methyl-accepting chemotaxis protein [Rhodoferax sp. OV413]|uniref:methyl-accepting chemotaxis protein n=1 Tax=Rhodoferax sp. OV413 TaxID=1855285 RepID=UPI00088F729F|nr:methyl-accepting chemotaxis protein [Rhodoferax sp. OV413]SDP35860.1 methyl-accepting chemotaxis protein [Rhodoferax sp. OV413]
MLDQQLDAMVQHTQAVGIPDLSDLPVRMGLVARLAMAFGVVLLLFAITTASSIYQLRAVEQGMQDAMASGQRLAAQARNMHDRVADAYLGLLVATMVDDLEDLQYESAALQKALGAYQSSYRQLFGTPQGAALQAHAAALQSAEAELRPLLGSAVQRLQLAAGSAGADYERDPAIQVLVVSSVKPLFDQWLRAIDALNDGAAQASAEAAAQAGAAARRARLWLAGAAAVALCLGAAAAWWIARGVTLPLRQAMALARQVAQGDLSQPMSTAAQDETGRLLTALGTMQDGLRALVGAVRESASAIDASASDVAAGNDDLSQRTENAAVSLRRTAEATTQLAGNVQQLAESASAAQQITGAATQAAQHGGAVVLRAQSSMTDISRSSQRMAEIVGMIDSFAFRTNILALNASIEAAGAGPHGRGFAVVASEVRALSQGVASAAKDIRQLIEQSAGEVASGQRHVENAARSMADIVGAVDGLASFVTEIASAAAEQGQGIAEVDQSVHELERLTQQNAALVEQSAAAAMAMSQEAERLTGLVSVFRLEPNLPLTT